MSNNHQWFGWQTSRPTSFCKKCQIESNPNHQLPNWCYRCAGLLPGSTQRRDLV